MKLETTNPNYCATVVRVNKVNPIEWSDNLVQVHMFGYNVVASKDLKLWELYILFTAETELNTQYLYQNNLYSKVIYNKDVNKKGYIDTNWRIKAIKLRWVSSNAILMPLKSLSYLWIKIDLKEWDTFNNINWVEVCKKYILPIKETTPSGNKTKGITKKYERIDGKQFPEHFDTEQFFKNADKYNPSDIVTVTQKLHGTSLRAGNVKVKVKPTLWDRILRRQRYEYDYIAGSRRVIKDLSTREYNHYYTVEKWSKDIYNKALDEIKSYIPKDTIIYAEIIGWNNNTPIQSGYTYWVPQWDFKVYIYRIVSINADNITTDWSYSAIKQFCNNNWLNYCPILYEGKLSEIDIESLMDLNYSLHNESFKDIMIPLPSNQVDEWVCIRKEGITPYVTKAKSPLFLEFETKQLDKWVIDLESNQI